jgi:integrase/recombinase XerC
VVDLLNRNIQTKSVNRKLSTLKTFYKYLRKNGMIDTIPMDKMIAPKIKKTLPEFVSNESMIDIFEKIEFENNFTDIRNRLIIEMLYCTGIRLSELVNLKTSEIDFYNQQIKVKGKRNKERLIPFDTILGDSIREYLIMRKEVDSIKNSEQLFLTKKGKGIYNKLVYRIVNTYLNKVSTLKKKSPHVLRHTFATHMLNNGADLNTVKELLGHANLSATQIYTHNTIDKLKTIYKQAHPRA